MNETDILADAYVLNKPVLIEYIEGPGIKIVSDIISIEIADTEEVHVLDGGRFIVDAGARLFIRGTSTDCWFTDYTNRCRIARQCRWST